MILDSVFRIASADIKKHGKLPRGVTIKRDNVKFHFPIDAVVAMASRITRIQTDKNDPNRAPFIIRRTAWRVYTKRKASKFGGWVLNDKEKEPFTGEGVMETRTGYANGLSGLAYERLLAIYDPTLGPYKDLTHHNAFMKALEGIELIIVDTKEQSYLLQNYLARRSIMTIVVTGDEVEGYYDNQNVKAENNDVAVFSDVKVVAHG